MIQIQTANKKQMDSGSSYHVMPMKSAQDQSTFYIHSFENKNIETKSEVFIFLHGAVAHSLREKKFFEWMLNKSKGKMIIYAPDFIGHGVSSGPRVYCDSFDTYVADLIQVLTFVQEKHAQVPLFLMGHSMGALINLKLYFQNNQTILNTLIAGFIYSNPCIKPHMVVDFPGAKELVSQMKKLTPYLRLPRIHKGADLVSDPLEANLFDTDHLIPHFMTASMIYEILKTSDEIRSMPYFYHHPTLFLLSDQDVVVDTEMTELFIKAIDKKWTKTLKYLDCKHELLHEKCHQKVWEDIWNWKANRLKEITCKK